MKPRISYSQFVAQQPKNTVAALIERYITEMATSPEMKPCGESQTYTLRAMARTPLGEKLALKITKSDVIAYCRMRRQQFVINTTRLVTPMTVGKEVSCLGVVLKYAGSGAWEDCFDVSSAAVDAAKKFLVKHGLISKGNHRTRVPTDDELRRITEYLKDLESRGRSTISYIPVLLFALASTRRLGEICRMTYGDIDWDHKDKDGNPAPMYVIRDVKHPTKKKGNDVRFALLDPMPEILRMQKRLTDDPAERVFPYNPKSISQGYIEAKKKLGIEGLRFHDNRREATTRWLAILKDPALVKFITGHTTGKMVETTYNATDSVAAPHAAFAEFVKRQAAQQVQPG